MKKKNKKITEAARGAFAGKLSLCMIVRDESRHIRDCIESVKMVVDEIVVVDTGSGDDTREIATELGAKVFNFPWSDDFSAARNESIRRATGDYILWLDADDRMDPQEVRKLGLLKAKLDVRKNQAYYLVLNSQSPIDGETLFHQMRLFPKIPGALFEGRVHEQIFEVLARLGVRLIPTDIVIRHIGYPDVATSVKKTERNLAILRQALNEEPGN
ncbi:MAG TPA: glycosyltransferase family 2 protein, partial [Thermodesulfobacteriota bacterium]|nr:glycosyltransferase family 2 protein [Thermodesulfobacteriota bacterium]